MGPGIFMLFQSFCQFCFETCFNFVSKHFETTETFGLSQFLSWTSPFQECLETPEMGLVSICFETTEMFSNFHYF